MDAMMTQVVSGLLAALGLYLAIGVPIAVAFVLLGVGRIDGAARTGTLGFRVFILPGVVAFWPAMLVRWIRAGKAGSVDGGEA
jgi:hypothetical protein